MLYMITGNYEDKLRTTLKKIGCVNIKYHICNFWGVIYQHFWLYLWILHDSSYFTQEYPVFYLLFHYRTRICNNSLTRSRHEKSSNCNKRVGAKMIWIFVIKKNWVVVIIGYIFVLFDRFRTLIKTEKKKNLFRKILV